MADPTGIVGTIDLLARRLADLRIRYKDWLSNPEEYQRLSTEIQHFTQDVKSIDIKINNNGSILDELKLKELRHYMAKINSLCESSKDDLVVLEKTILNEEPDSFTHLPVDSDVDQQKEKNSSKNTLTDYSGQPERNIQRTSNTNIDRGRRLFKKSTQPSTGNLKSFTRVKRDTEILRAVDERLREGRILLSNISSFIHLHEAINLNNQEPSKFVQHFDSPFQSENWVVDFSLTHSNPNSDPSSNLGTNSAGSSIHPNILSQEAQVKKIILSFHANPDLHIQPTQSNIVPSLCVYGQGGMGKSVVLQSICHDQQIRTTFYDGVHFLTLGQNATTQDVIHQFSMCVRHAGYEKLSKEILTMQSADEAAREVSVIFKGKRVLFVADDLWVSERSGTGFLREVKTLGAMSEGAILFSTRDESLGNEGREKIFFDFLEPKGEGSRMILGSCVRRETHRGKERDVFEGLDEEAERALDKILELCGGWKLCLAVAGSALSEDIREIGNDVSLGLTEYIVRVEEDEEGLIHGTTADYHEHNLIKIAESSVGRCKEWSEKRAIRRLCDGDLGMEEMFRSLCVIEKQKWMRMEVLFQMWGVSERYGETVVKQMVRMNLMSRTLEKRKGTTARLIDRVERLGTRRYGRSREWLIRVHDRMIDVCVNLAQEKDDGGTKKWHKLLLNRCIAEHNSISLAQLETKEGIDCELMRNGAKCREWWDEKKMNGKYMMKNLARHLVGSGMWNELFHVLTDVRWTLRRREEGGLVDLRDDFDRLIVAMKEHERERDQYNQVQEMRRRESDGVHIIVDVISDCWNILRDKKHQFGFQVFGRIREADRRYLAVSRFMHSVDHKGPKPWLKPMRTGLFGYEDERQRGQLQLKGDCWEIRLSSDQRSVVSWDDSSFDDLVKLFILDLRSRETEDFDLKVDKKPSCFDFCFATFQIAFGFEDGTIEIRDTKTGNCVRNSLKCHCEMVTCVSFSTTGSRLVSKFVDGTLQIWDLHMSQSIGEPLIGRAAWINAIALTQDGSHFISESPENTLSIWSMKTGSFIDRFETGSRGYERCVTFNSDNTRVASGSTDGAARVWDLQTRMPIGPPMIGDQGGPTSIGLNENANLLVAGYERGVIILWNVNTGSPIGEPLFGHDDRVTYVGFSKNEGGIVSVSIDQTLRFWSIPSNFEPPQVTSTISTINESGSTSSSLVLSGDRNRAIFTSNLEEVHLWDVRRNQLISRQAINTLSSLTCVGMNEDGSQILMGFDDGYVLLWNVYCSEFTHPDLYGHTKAVTCVAFSKDGNYAVSGSRDGSLQTWNLEVVIDMSTPLLGNRDCVQCVSFSEDGKRIASGSHNMRIRIWDTKTSSQMAQFQYEDHPLCDLYVFFSGSNDCVMTCSSEGVIRAWSIEEQRETCEPLQSISDVRHAKDNLIKYETWLQEQVKHLNTSNMRTDKHICVRTLNNDVNKIFSKMGFTVYKRFDCESNTKHICNVEHGWDIGENGVDSITVNKSSPSITLSNGKALSLADTSKYLEEYDISGQTIAYILRNGKFLSCIVEA